MRRALPAATLRRQSGLRRSKVRAVLYLSAVPVWNLRRRRVYAQLRNQLGLPWDAVLLEGQQDLRRRALQAGTDGARWSIVL